MTPRLHLSPDSSNASNPITDSSSKFNLCFYDVYSQYRPAGRRHPRSVVLPFGREFGSLCYFHQCTIPTGWPFVRLYPTIWLQPIRVDRVVVVEVAARVLIPRIVAVASVRATQANVLRYILHPVYIMVMYNLYIVLHLPGSSF